ncbi:hypothetical protein BH23GEM9_BH23GEM9_15970 [soil metagenome]
MYSVFADESSIGDRYMGFGAILVPTPVVPIIEAWLEAYCAQAGFQGREMAWKKCGPGKVPRCTRFMNMFWELVRAYSPIDFRAIVLDRARYPLRAPQYGAHTEEEGFYRFYHSFLTRSIAKVASGAAGYQLHIAMTPDRYPHRSDILRKTVGGTVGRGAGRPWQIVDVIRGQPKSYRVHQLADVLLGAVMHRVNARNDASPKEMMVQQFEARLGKRLDEDCMPSERPFNVWFFARAGDSRWAPGGSGRVRR